MTRVLVLCGGPDAEHDVSVDSGKTIGAALDAASGYDIDVVVFDELTPARLGAMPGDVVFPALHGPFGEGGALQRMLEADGRPYVGSGPRVSRAALDKVLTKTIGVGLGLRVLPSAILDPSDTELGLDLPVVVKPVFEGSTIGLFVCETHEQWLEAHAASAGSGKPVLIEAMTPGRELTVGVVDMGSGLESLPIIEIIPAEGLYDYEAKYSRDDTAYVVDPDLPSGVGQTIRGQALDLARAMGIRDLCRADFILDDQGEAVFLEVNTMPGFTSHSLFPMAAKAAGCDLQTLCTALVENALERSRRHGRQEEASSQAREAAG